MSSLFKKLENWFAAIAFAEEGEHNTALAMVGLKTHEATQTVGVIERLNTAFAAAAFAEADCHDIAKEILDPADAKGSFIKTLGLKGIRIWHGFVPAADESFFQVVGLVGVPSRIGVVSL